ncbi:unnamed protein product [Rotaria sordida]|uniref:DNA-directed RNA polymerase III subunit n=1 Tax=Rotaria sordida TaxID=392033 RepID=A0A813QFT1_9BILA|nr:unnamed protein product [Rotaria sordida]CAF0766333.1 unnamed protein product [Rotaria sordida]CAF0768898.1 unnamed protein product [Rotaria sordida]CAF0801386.1 unnamed protein product [Rotaria sordida]CAF0809283.1 unnamed protein product [Rotaria sordida]
MASGRGHASFTIDTLKLAKDSLPATVNEPPPVYPELLNTPHSLIENPINDYDYKLKLKFNFNSSFRTLHDPTKDDHEKNFILNKWIEEWSILPRELKQASRININSSKFKPNLLKKNIITQNNKKKTRFNIDLNVYEEKPMGDGDDDDEQEEGKKDDNADVNENDDDNEGKLKDAEKKKLTDNENEVDGDVPNEEEDMDEDEAADYTYSYFDPGDRDDDDFDDDGGDGIE